MTGKKNQKNLQNENRPHTHVLHEFIVRTYSFYAYCMRKNITDNNPISIQESVRVQSTCFTALEMWANCTSQNYQHIIAPKRPLIKCIDFCHTTRGNIPIYTRGKCRGQDQGGNEPLQRTATFQYSVRQMVVSVIQPPICQKRSAAVLKFWH